MRALRIDNEDIIIYDENIYLDCKILMKCGSITVTTKQMKECISNVITTLNNAIELSILVNEKLEKFNIAVKVLKNLYQLFDSKKKRQAHPKKEEVDILIDVIEELAIAETSDIKEKKAIRMGAAFLQSVNKNNL